MAGELGFDTGPFVNVAVFCERVLQEKDNVLSAIRIVDQINVQAQGNIAPEDLPAGSTIQSTLLVMLKAGEARGPQTIQVVIEDPVGGRREGPEQSVVFSPGPAGGVNLIIPLMMQLSSAGLYWADVLINRRLVSRVPLTVNYTFTRGPGVAPQQS
jgi:hypothetical protein